MDRWIDAYIDASDIQTVRNMYLRISVGRVGEMERWLV